MAIATRRRRKIFPDRAFRALAREEPDIIYALLTAALPGIIPQGKRLTPAHVDDPHLDTTPYPIDADFLVRVGRRDLFHAEFQGYRDKGFLRRLFRYHLASVQRYPDRVVHSVAIWLIPPPARQRSSRITVGNVSVDVTCLVLPEVPAATLLKDPRTACFAPGADLGSMTVEELCQRTVETLHRAGASFHQWRVAGVVAVLQKRYKVFMRAMQEARIKPLVCEELMNWGQDNYRRGLRRGRSQGLKQARETLLNVLAARSIPLSKADHEKILREHSLQRLLEWIQRTVTASSAAEVFST